jgi:hypothetical protein
MAQHRAEQDISPGNMLVNHYSADPLARRSEARRSWRTANTSTKQVRYCYIDFDISMILPKDVRRLPSDYAFEGQLLKHPKDVHAGEHDYDPYAFDVACLGILFASYFDVSCRSLFFALITESWCQAMVPQVPLLAPLLDKMTTEDIQARFSAREALNFTLLINESLTDDQRKSRPLPRDPEAGTWRTIGHRWVGLPDHFVKQWSGYAAFRPSLFVQFIRWMCDYDFVFRVIRWLRRTIRR